MQPGDTITPNGQPPVDEQKPVQPINLPPEPIAQPSLQPQQSVVVQSQPISEPQPTPVFEQTFQDTSEPASAVSWTASEYIDHAKGPAWFALTGIGIVLLSVVVYFLLKDFVAPVLLALAGATVAVFAGRKPQVIRYVIDSTGIHIGQRAYSYGDFKSFSLTEAGPLPAILLTPLKRFLPPITIFYDPNEEDKIVDALADYLPHEDKEPDLVDKIMGRIRF